MFAVILFGEMDLSFGEKKFGKLMYNVIVYCRVSEFGSFSLVKLCLFAKLFPYQTFLLYGISKCAAIKWNRIESHGISCWLHISLMYVLQAGLHLLACV